mmetsp:Transcript_7899/g.20373  ORF Transcript_7899/g.20373 Transcript_7899/m.20373 type:complete len:230 (+) Transcript_7899:1325-2014(+)
MGRCTSKTWMTLHSSSPPASASLCPTRHSCSRPRSCTSCWRVPRQSASPRSAWRFSSSWVFPRWRCGLRGTRRCSLSSYSRSCLSSRPCVLWWSTGAHAALILSSYGAPANGLWLSLSVTSRGSIRRPRSTRRRCRARTSAPPSRPSSAWTRASSGVSGPRSRPTLRRQARSSAPSCPWVATRACAGCRAARSDSDSVGFFGFARLWPLSPDQLIWLGINLVVLYNYTK